MALATESVESGRALGVLDALVATSQDALRRQHGLTRQARRGRVRSGIERG